MAKSSDKPFFPAAGAFPVNPTVSRPGRPANSRPRFNPPVYRTAPKVVPNHQQQQQQAEDATSTQLPATSKASPSRATSQGDGRKARSNGKSGSLKREGSPTNKGKGTQAGNKVRNTGKPGKPDKGSNSPEYENTCPSQPSSNEQKPEIRHGEHQSQVRGELRPKTITSIIDADSGLARLAEEACDNQRVQDNVNHLQDELAKGNDNSGIHKKYLGNNVWEHRAHGGGRLYTREFGDKVEILAKSGKGTQNQSKVIKRVKELYVNKKN